MKEIVGTWPWDCCEILMYFDKFLEEWDLYVKDKFVYNDKVYLLLNGYSMALPGVFGFYLTCSRKKHRIYFYTLDRRRLGWIRKDFTIKHILTILNQTRIDNEDDYYNTISKVETDNEFFRKDLFTNFLSKELGAEVDIEVNPIDNCILVVCCYDGIIEYYTLNVRNNSVIPLPEVKVTEYSYNLNVTKYFKYNIDMVEYTMNADRVIRVIHLIEFYFKSLPKSVKYIRL